jgi:hypothetical protein
LPAEHEGQERRDGHEARELGRSDVPRAREEGAPAGAVEQAEGDHHEGQSPHDGGQVGRQRPFEVDRPEHLHEQHKRKQGHGAREHVLARGVVLDEQRQPGPPKAPLVSGDVVHAGDFTLCPGRPPGTRS